MALIPYEKPYATAKERIAHLRARGLIIRQPNVAARRIEEIGYERLRIYFLSRRQQNIPNKPFIPGTTYQDIIKLYECDEDIRDACFSAVGTFELLLRNSISEVLSQEYGSHPYDDVDTFRDPAARLDALQKFVDVYHKSKDGRARHYRETYRDPVLPPIWIMKEFITFGEASRILKNLARPNKTKIASQFGMGSEEVFINWVAAFVDLRNMCAHHDRLFNRSFQKQPIRLRSPYIPRASPEKLKAVLECLDHVVSQRSSPVNITNKVHKIIQRCPAMNLGEAGF